ncbi:hypothetical protein G6F35_014658 [Rhizopus arrhizus]|nr:hypothetical protein G6F35_014658 [Rhizopus arrhizus]
MRRDAESKLRGADRLRPVGPRRLGICAGADHQVGTSARQCIPVAAQHFAGKTQRGRAFQRLEFVDQVVQGPPRQYGADGDTQLHFPAGGDAFHAAGQIVQRLQHVAPVLQQGFARGRQQRPVS